MFAATRPLGPAPITTASTAMPPLSNLLADQVTQWFDEPRGDRPDDGHEQYVRGRERGQFGVHGTGGDREPGDDDGELAPGDQRGAGTCAAHPGQVPGREPARAELGDGR